MYNMVIVCGFLGGTILNNFVFFKSIAETGGNSGRSRPSSQRVEVPAAAAAAPAVAPFPEVPLNNDAGKINIFFSL